MKQKELLFLIISIFILVFIWIVFSIYHSSDTSTISEQLNMKITPINPNFNGKVFDGLKERKKIEPIYDIKKIQEISTSSANPLPTPILTPTFQSTGSAGGT